LPADRQFLVTSPADLDAWNDRQLAERPAGQTVGESLVQWRDSCEEIRRLTAPMTDANLEGPFWMPLYRGWAAKRDGLDFCRNHAWSEFTQLRVHMGRNEPVPSPSITHDYLAFILTLFPMLVSREAALNPFTIVMAFTDPGVGAWTITVADGAATLSEGAAPNADLVLTQSAETFEKSFRRMQDAAALIQAGAIQVSNFEGLAAFGRLFPM
jgi:hypothetical protein